MSWSGLCHRCCMDLVTSPILVLGKWLGEPHALSTGVGGGPCCTDRAPRLLHVQGDLLGLGQKRIPCPVSDRALRPLRLSPGSDAAADCCLTISSKHIPPRIVTSYRIQTPESGCRLRAIV